MASSGGAGIGPPPVPKGITIGRGTNWYKAAQAAQNPPVPPAPYTGPKGITIGQGTNWYNRTQQVQNKYQGAPGSAPQATPQQNQGASSQGSGNPFLDATYYNKTGTNLFNVNNQIGALGQEMTNNDIALKTAIGQLEEQRPIDQLKQMYAANRSGGLYGSVEAGDQGLITRGYDEKESGLRTNEGNVNLGLQGKIDALTGGIPLYNQGEAIASTNRVATLIANNPALAKALGIPVPSSSATHVSSAPASSPAGGNAGGNNKGGGLVNYGNFGVPKGAKAPGPNPVLKGPGQAPKGKGKNPGPAPKSKSGGAGY